jgi:TonB-dependent Receptor Plug Domain
VRGGSVGQNLVLLDEAPVYQSSHLFGFFSVFNPDAVKDVELYRGGIPAQYGGRISSLLDVRMKEGNNKEYNLQGGLGTIFSRLSVEGPIQKNKSSFIIAGRRSYADVVAKGLTNAVPDDVQLYFYDLTAKTNFNINKNNRVFLSGYFGRDVFKFDKFQGFDWGNRTATLRWNHLYGNKLFSNFTLFHSNYDYGFQIGEDESDKYDWNSVIRTYNFKSEFSWFLNTNHEISFGGESILYDFRPASAESVSEGVTTDISLDERKGIEASLFISDNHHVNEKLSLQYGLRFSTFSYRGGTTFHYGDTIPGIKRPLRSTSENDEWEQIAAFYNPEPRLSVRYQLSRSSSLKASYNRMVQYIHLISNTTASTPIDIWQPSSNNIKPQLADQVALGYFRNFKNNQYETSAEVYYKTSRNQVDYIDGADLFINQFLESQLLRGIGRAYGLELYAKKNTGRVTGWVSYTLGKTELKVNGINYGADHLARSGDWYPARYDQRHNFKIASFYELKKNITLSANFSYISGTPTTFPTDRIMVQGYVIPYISGSARNNYRIPDYHRLDVAVTFDNIWRGRKGRAGEDNLVLSVYNAYARKNPFSIYFSQGTARQPDNAPATTSARQLSMIGTVVPAITYNFKF